MARRHRVDPASVQVDFELRSAGDKELVYEAQLPMDIRIDRVSNAICGCTPRPRTEMQVVWDDKKKK